VTTISTQPIVAQLTPAQNALAHKRAKSLHSAAPTMTVEGFLWLHATIFTGIDENAGEVRPCDAALEGFSFAKPELILSCLEDRFAELIANDGYRTPDRSAFYHGLAHHLSELHAIAPFNVGNLRTIAAHCEQLARAADQQITTCDGKKTLWEHALYQAFVHQGVDEVAALLSGIIAADVSNDNNSVGICGTARLADRFLPRGRRQFMYLASAQEVLHTYLQQARAQAEQRVSDLSGNGAPLADVEAAGRECDYLNHSKGAEFQVKLLAEIGVRRIEVINRPDQSALERIREIAYGMMIAIDSQPSEIVEAAYRRLLQPRYLGNGSPHQARMADQFLKNSAVINRSDLRFATAQRLVDKASDAVAQMKGRDTAAMHEATKQMRLDIANRIRTGEMEIGSEREVTSQRFA
jgi:fido (protein-threonine AMPylation protein)